MLVELKEEKSVAAGKIAQTDYYLSISGVVLMGEELGKKNNSSMIVSKRLNS